MSRRATRRLPAALALCSALWLGPAQPETIAAPGAMVPEMIGEGVLSTPDDEFGATPAPDGQTLYFDKTVPPHYLYVICAAHLRNGRWTEPEVLPFSGLYRDSDPVLSPDGNTLFFASDRPVDGVDSHRFLIWRAKKRAGGWEEPTLVPGVVNSAGSQVFASEATNGTLYFTSSRNGQYDIYRAKPVNGSYLEAEDLGPLVNGQGIWSLEAWIAPDESYLLIGSFGREGYGNSDLYVSFPEKGGWSKPVDLGPAVNTVAREYSPRVSPDGQWLYYTSEMGMPYEKRTEPVTYQQFEAGMRSVRNGLGNLYRLPLAPVLAAARSRAAEKRP